MIKASVIVPMYNCEYYVDQCLASIIGQTIGEIEIILVIRPGTDKTVEKCISWEKKDKRIVVRVVNERGLGYARNYALQMAKGKYIVYIDADDTIEPDFVEKMILPLEEDEDIDITCCGFDRRLQDGNVTDGWMPPQQGLVEMDFRKYRSLIYYGVVWLKVYRRDFLIANKLYQYKGCHEDDAMHMMLAAVVKSVFFIQEPLYHYENGNEESLTHNKENDLEYYDAMRFAIEYLNEREIFHLVHWDVYHCIRNTTKRFLKDVIDIRFIKKEEQLLQIYFPKELLVEEAVQKNTINTFSEEIVVFGYGADGKRFLKDIESSKVRAIIDNSCSLYEETVEGIPIYTLEDYLQLHDNTDIVICSSYYYWEMAELLLDKGIKNFYSMEKYEKGLF